MALEKMIVSAVRGEESDGKSSSEAKFPYEFYAKKNTSDNNTYVIKLVMPLGGKESGLFRYPKAEEKILVDTDGENYYLLGYLPSESEAVNNFLTNTANSNSDEKSALQNEAGLVLRYEQTGKVTPSTTDVTDRYSEIGFYHRPTQWRSNDSAYKDFTGKPLQNEGETDAAYSARLVAAGPSKNTGESDADYITRVMRPGIDHLNIQSSGDLYAGAKNYQRLTAKRFELLVGCKAPAHAKAQLSKEELPLGDNVGDDSTLHAGDVHIRAKKRVVIKAGKEIILQVGKTALKISDNSLDVISKIVNSNATNSYDATMKVSKDGVTMFGQAVNISSYRTFGIGDAFGGSVGGVLGVVSIGGREIKAAAYDATQYKMLAIAAAVQYAQSIAAASGGMAGDLTASKITKYTNFVYKFLKDLYLIGESIVDVYRKWREVYRESRIEKEKYAEAEKNKKIEAIEAKKQAELARIAKALQDGKISQNEADKMKAVAEEKAAKDIADAIAEREKIAAEAKEVEDRRKAEKEEKEVKAAIDKAAKAAKDAADKDAEDKKKEIDEKVKKGEMTRKEADNARDEADRIAKDTKKAVEEDRKAAWKAAENLAAGTTPTPTPNP
ncbi:MAG: hypothetical protein LBK63_10815 [Treponema sp.]|jgi:hypothetical protein|nr:hypothetical protein [Treponema sp.]